MIIDITWCTSKKCDKKNICQRHIDVLKSAYSNDEEFQIVSMCDFSIQCCKYYIKKRNITANSQVKLDNQPEM